MGATCDTGPDYLVTAPIKFTSYSIGGRRDYAAIYPGFLGGTSASSLRRGLDIFIFTPGGETEVCQEPFDV